MDYTKKPGSLRSELLEKRETYKKLEEEAGKMQSESAKIDSAYWRGAILAIDAAIELLDQQSALNGDILKNGKGGK